MKEKPLKILAGAPDRPLIIGDIEIQCYVLEIEGRVCRVLHQTGLLRALDLSHGGSYSRGGDRLAKFTSQGRLKPFLTNELMMRTDTPIKFKPPGTKVAHGYEATVLAEICEAVLSARSAGVLQRQQQHVADRCELLMRGFARVGIIALVDEATGYQELRDRYALNKILDKYLLEERAKWAKRFPDEFYREIFRLRDWEWRGMKVNRPQVVGIYTNDIIWDRLAPGVREELERLNPKTEKGSRRTKHHQWLTFDIGHPALQKHINIVIALMKSVVQAKGGWDEFRRRLQRVIPKVNTNLDLP